MEIRQTLCHICAYEEDGKIMELRFEPVGGKSSLGNIYVGQIENIAANIGAAFVQISAGERCYLQLSDASNAIYTSVRKGDRPLKPGDEILVQISRDAMKELITAHGGKASSSVSKKTSFLLAGTKPGAEKLKKCEELGVKVISEEQFRKMLPESETSKGSNMEELTLF